jgi:DNA-binding response OmpR family regulator
VITTLVIDDEAPIRLLCRVNLEAEGMRVLEAADGRAGIELAQNEQPNAILLDVMMPGLDGWAVADQLLQNERTAEIPIIFLTARADLRDRARGMDLGGLEYITKPFNPVELATLIQEVIAAVERGEREQLRTERIARLRSLFEGV